MVEAGIPELTTEQIELLCSVAENAARKFVLSKVSSKKIDKLDLSVEAEGTKPLNITVEISLELTPETKTIDADVLVKEATSKAHQAAEEYLRKLK